MIKNTIKEEIKYYKDKGLKCNPSYAQTTPDVLELINLYTNSKYKKGEYDSNNYKKPFFNVSDTPVDVGKKEIDIDTKDFKFYAEEGQEYYTSYFFGKDFRVWVKEIGFAKTLNKVSENLPRWGHVVFKKVGSKIYNVDMEKIMSDPEVESMYDSDFVIERHDYTYAKFKKTGKEKKWKNVQAIYDAHKKAKKKKVTILERYGDDDESDNNFFIVSGLEEGLGEDEFVLFEGKKDIRDTYKEIKYTLVKGRWLGRGEVERNFEPQIAKNEINYFYHRGLEWTSLHIFQSRDPTISGNLLTGVTNGDILRANEPVNPIPMEERNLSAFSYGDQKWDSNITSRSFSWDVMRGQQPKSGTTLGQSIMQSKMAGGHFGFIRERIGIFWKDVIYDWVVPIFLKESSKKHTLLMGEFNDAEIDKLRRAFLKHRKNLSIVDYIAKNGRYPESEELSIMSGIIKKQIKGEKNINMRKDLYKDIKVKMEVDITAESIDAGQKATMLQAGLTMIAQNPQVIENPRTRGLVFDLFELMGISPTRFEIEEPTLEESMAMMNTGAPRGGSMPRQPMQSSPQSIKTTQSV